MTSHSTNRKPALGEFRAVTVGALQRDSLLKARIEKLLQNEDYELIMPPDSPDLGDLFLEGGTHWTPVTSFTYEGRPYSDNHYIAKRPTEHLKMFWFFFGNKR